MIDKLIDYLKMKFNFLMWYHEKASLVMRTDNHEGVRLKIIKNPELLKQTLRDIVETSFKTDISKRILIYGEDENSKKIQDIKAKMKNLLEVIDSGIIHDDVISSTEFAELFHCIIGVSSESGELAEALTRQMYGQPLDKVNMIEEIGDVCWYLVHLASYCCGSLKQAMILNIKKLLKRYRGGYSDKKAINRDTSEERKILESVENK